MPIPIHHYASVPVGAPASVVHDRLRADAHGLVAGATADALAVTTPLLRRWGLAASGLPTVTARVTGRDEIGSIEVVWGGDEGTTGWPALTGRLLVVPDAAGRTRLGFVSERSPDAELTTARLDRLHRRRVVEVGIRSVLYGLARHLGTVSDADAVGQGEGRCDRAPRFLHHLCVTGHEPDRLRALLLADPTGLAERATRVAVVRAADALRAGGFRAPAAPRVGVRPGRTGVLGVLDLSWEGDEEATGWPRLTCTVLVEAYEAGSRLAVLSSREPGYDLSLNRIDRFARHQVLRQAGADLAAAIVGELDAAPRTAGRGVRVAAPEGPKSLVFLAEATLPA